MKKSDREPVADILRRTDMFTLEEIHVAEEIVDIYLYQPDQKDYHVLIVENSNRKVAGFMIYGPTPMTEGTFDLYWIGVTPEDQGHGYGKEMVCWLENKVQRAKGRMIVIETSSQTRYEPTRQFYLRNGYREIARIPGFYRPGDDRIIYTKNYF